MKDKVLRFLSNQSPLFMDCGLLVLRLGFGAGMLTHGVPKLLGFAEKSQSFPDPLGMGASTSLALAVFAEVFCALGVTVGLLTRLALIPLVVTMLVAMFLVLGGAPWAKQEPAFTYLVPYLVLLLTGPGRFSLDAVLFKRQS